MNKLKHYRELRGLTQEQLGKLSRISQPQIARMEHDPDHKYYRQMSGVYARRLAAVLRVGVFELSGSLDALVEDMSEREIGRIAKMIEAFKTRE